MILVVVAGAVVVEAVVVVSDPPLQADAVNRIRTKTQVLLPLTFRVCHARWSVTQRESRRVPLRPSNIGKLWAAYCDNLCHQEQVTESESTDRPEISGLSVVVQLVECS